MYVRTRCTACGRDQYHKIKLHALEIIQFKDLDIAAGYAVECV